MIEAYIIIGFILVMASAGAQSPTDVCAILSYIGCAMFLIPLTFAFVLGRKSD